MKNNLSAKIKVPSFSAQKVQKFVFNTNVDWNKIMNFNKKKFKSEMVSNS